MSVVWKSEDNTCFIYENCESSHMRIALDTEDEIIEHQKSIFKCIKEYQACYGRENVDFQILIKFEKEPNPFLSCQCLSSTEFLKTYFSAEMLITGGIYYGDALSETGLTAEIVSTISRKSAKKI